MAWQPQTSERASTTAPGGWATLTECHCRQGWRSGRPANRGRRGRRRSARPRGCRPRAGAAARRCRPARRPAAGGPGRRPGTGARGRAPSGGSPPSPAPARMLVDVPDVHRAAHHPELVVAVQRRDRLALVEPTASQAMPSAARKRRSTPGCSTSRCWNTSCSSPSTAWGGAEVTGCGGPGQAAGSDPPERLRALVPGIGGAEADVLEQVVVERQQGPALPAPLGPALECYEHAAEGRRGEGGRGGTGSAIMVRLLAELAMSGM